MNEIDQPTGVNSTHIYSKENNSSRSILKIVLITGLLASIVSLILMYGGNGGNASKTLEVTFGPLPYGQIYTFYRNSDSFTPMTLEVGGENLPVIDRVMDSNGSEILIALTGKGQHVSNIFTKNKEGIIRQITFSDTLKTNISHDSLLNITLYQSADFSKNQRPFQDFDWSITRLDTRIAEDKEELVAKGKDAILLQGQEKALVYQNGGVSLYSIGEKVAKGEDIMKIAGAYIYATNSNTSKIAIYNTRTKNIDEFNIHSGGFLNYIRSLPVSTPVTALMYISESVAFASGDSKEKSVIMDQSNSVLYSVPTGAMNMLTISRIKTL